MEEIIWMIQEAFKALPDIESKVFFLNRLREELGKLSPFKEPVDKIKWVKNENVFANAYNPNKVASPEMRLLYLSIKLDGFTQPIVAYRLGKDKYEVVDGFHRNKIGKEYEDIKARTYGYMPLVVIDKPLNERMGSTIRHNRARGSHQIRSMSDLVIDLSKEGWSDQEICKKLGMELDEVIRLKQISGLKEAFKNHSFSKSWEEFEGKYYGTNVA